MLDPQNPSTWSVFPLYAILPNGSCACGRVDCTQVGKHPACNWATSSDPFPGARTDGVGIRTGTPSGIWVLDIDRKNGVDGLAEIRKLGPLPKTLTVRTPSGGLHLYFLLPDFPVPTKAGILPGVDVRGEGGFVVSPYSSHKNGGRYLIEQTHLRLA